jgi:hypothetical protein
LTVIKAASAEPGMLVLTVRRAGTGVQTTWCRASAYPGSIAVRAAAWRAEADARACALDASRRKEMVLPIREC